MRNVNKHCTPSRLRLQLVLPRIMIGSNPATGPVDSNRADESTSWMFQMDRANGPLHIL